MVNPPDDERLVAIHINYYGHAEFVGDPTCDGGVCSISVDAGSTVTISYTVKNTQTVAGTYYLWGGLYADLIPTIPVTDTYWSEPFAQLEQKTKTIYLTVTVPFNGTIKIGHVGT